LGDAISSNLPAIALLLAGLCLVAIVVMQSLMISSLRRRVDQLTGGQGEGTLEDVLIQHLESVHAMGHDLDELIARTAFLESSARHHYAREGLVRFNPFPDTGGNQSFALALLDESNDGVIISSLHSRTGTRIYAKAVVAGKTDTNLSAEEAQAIDEAMSRRPASAPQPRPRATGPAREPARGSASRTVETAAASGQPASSTAPATAKAVPTRVATPNPEPPAPAVGSAAAPVKPAAAPDAPVDEEGEEPVRKPISRPVSSKGQTKGDSPAQPDDAADAEKTGPRPGRSTGIRP
jgi:hypothetical protein